ncbi:type III-B CRISPR module-associated protein Cmr5 [Thiospirillum jenense]|uniref:CRISPR type III-B/RAMP module-associated protein Cmr5 n=1 Tax=Thiospirillum jenense TaxID=1653858 RepID=A0A839HEI2_9GAMM|nr:type III-B CRISPR module-associated protein Cmr5 [Thiospirillum jenense]MBB1125587.1 type III-B CRISPR module-associated protein Cmr5 [Thiospirillum jenense]
MKMRAHCVAAAAYERVAARQNADNTKKYGAIVHKLPGMILQNGLAQATGFLLAKGSSAPEHLLVLDDLNAVLCAGDAVKTSDRDTLHRQIIAADLQQTLKLTRQALEAAGWLKRYVQGLLRVDATGESVDKEGK